MNEHRKHPVGGSTPDPSDDRHVQAQGEPPRTSPSVAPVAFDLDEIQEEPEALPQQPVPTFARNVVIAAVGMTAAIAIFGIARLMMLDPPEESAKQAAAMSSPNEGLAPIPIAPLEDPIARMSLARPALQSTLPLVFEEPESASVLPSPEEALIDEAVAAARLRCLSTTSPDSALMARLQFGIDGRVAWVQLEGLDFPPDTLECIEEVLDQLVVDGYRGTDVVSLRLR